MKVIPFRKPEVGRNTIRTRTWHENPVLARDYAEPISTMPADDFDDDLNDFSNEVEMTRATEPLMAMLEERANEPASASLQDLKNQIDIDQ